MLQDYQKINLAFVIIIFLVLLVATILFLMGCEETYTLSQARIILGADINSIEQADARAEYENDLKLGDQVAADLKKMAFIERVCVMASIASVVAVFVLGYLGMGKMAVLPLATLVGCFWGIVFIELDSHYPKALPIAGGAVTLLFGMGMVYYVVLHRKTLFALKEVIGNVEAAKSYKPLAKISDFLTRQSPTTKALVAKIRGKKKNEPTQVQ